MQMPQRWKQVLRPEFSNVKKLRRSTRIGDAGGRLHGSGLMFEGLDNGNVLQRVNPFDGIWTGSRASPLTAQSVHGREGVLAACMNHMCSYKTRSEESVTPIGRGRC